MTKAEEPTATTPTPAAHTHTATQAPAPNDSSLPLVSMILGILSLTTFMLFLGIPSLILGIIGLKKYPANRGVSIAGIIMGSISTLLMIGAVALMVFGLLLGYFSETNGWTSTPNDTRLETPRYFEDSREGA